MHNAFNTTVIEELHACFKQINTRDDIRVVVLAGRGKSFSAGADLNWMKQAGQASSAENEADALKLAQMLDALATLKQPTIARVHGIAFGGGMGLASACDICIASTDAKFATSEVRLGLAPSTISPYVIRAIGARQASRYFLTAERISAREAKHIGLAHEVADAEDLDKKFKKLLMLYYSVARTLKRPQNNSFKWWATRPWVMTCCNRQHIILLKFVKAVRQKKVWVLFK